jgi:hypothetical protein
MFYYIMDSLFIVLLLSHFKQVFGYVNNCGEEDNGQHPYCFPQDYNKVLYRLQFHFTILKPLLDTIPPTNESLDVHVDSYIFEVSKVDDKELSMTIELYFDLLWQETRLVINETSLDWGPGDDLMGSTNFIPEMWVPDIQIFNCKQFYKRQIVTDVAGLIFFKNKTVLYTVSAEVIISCPMKFSSYPLDHQLCKFMVKTFSISLMRPRLFWKLNNIHI